MSGNSEEARLEIKPGSCYVVTDIYEGGTTVVRVIERADSTEEHWKCVRGDGRKALLPASAFIKLVIEPGDETSR